MAASSSAVRTDAGYVGRAGILAGAAVTFAIVCVLRFLSVQFTNDHFVHLSRAQQILLGDVPIRDFFDPGLILTYYASAAALALSGRTLLGEAVLTVGFVAAGAALTFALATRLSGSYFVGIVSTVLVVVSSPRLYNYPKVFLYVLALGLAWRYVNRPGSGRLAALAVATAVAFLFRHDHGVYIGLSVAALIALRHWDRPRQGLLDFGVYLGVTAALLLPFFVFVQTTVGLRAYALGNQARAGALARPRLNRLPIRFDLSAPFAEVGPPGGPRLHVRWAPGLDEAARRAKEAQYGLTWSESLGNSTYRYVLEDQRRENLHAIVADPDVVDTHNIERGTPELHEPWWERLARRVPVMRITRVLPGVLTAGNALAWFYYVTFITPFVALVVLAMLAWRGRIARPELAFVGATILLSFVIVQTLVRGSPDSRMPDVAGPVAIVAAWTTGCWVRRRPSGPRSRGAVGVTVAVAMVWLVTLWSAWADSGWPVTRSLLVLRSGPARSWDAVTRVARDLGRRPNEIALSEGASGDALTRYLFECTVPSDRVLVTFFKPEVFFFAERGFAGGQVYLDAGWHDSEADQHLTVERLERQRAPVVLTLAYDPDAVVDPDDQAGVLPRGFPFVYEYLQTRYTVAAESAFGGDRVYLVLVDSRLKPTGTYAPLGLPCYR